MSSVSSPEVTQGPPVSAPPARPRKRIYRRLVVGAFAAIVLLAGLWGYVTLAWRWDLQAAVAEADRLDPGWRFEELEAAREAVSAAENSAPALLAVAAAVPPSWGNISFTPLRMTLDERLAGLPPAQSLDDADLAKLRAACSNVVVALDRARELAERPRGRYRISWRDDLVGTPVPHLDYVRLVARMLTVDAMLRSRDGDIDGAVQSCRALVNAGRSVGDEPAAVSQIVRAYCDREAVYALERALAAGTASAQALEEMQALLTDEEPQPLFLRAMRAERVSYFQALEVARLRGFDYKGYNFRSSWLGPTAHKIMDADWARGSEAPFLRWTNALVEVAKTPTETHDDQLQQLPRPWQQLPPILAGLTRGDDPAKLARNFNRTRAELRSAVVALAVQRFRQAEHRSPERADDLVPRYLPYFAPRPADPFDGQPLRWRRLKDGLVIYSVGPDRQDDGGNLDRKNPDRPGSDLGFQLRDGAAGQAVKD